MWAERGCRVPSALSTLQNVVPPPVLVHAVGQPPHSRVQASSGVNRDDGENVSFFDPCVHSTVSSGVVVQYHVDVSFMQDTTV